MSLTAGRTPQRKVFGEADKRHIPHPTPFVVTGAWELSSAPNPLCGDRCEGRADFTYPLQGRMASRAGSTSPESSEMDGDSRPEDIRAGSVPPEGGKPDGPQIPRKTLLGNSAGGGLPRIPRHVTITAIRPHSGCPLGYLGRSTGAPDTHPLEGASGRVG